MSDRRADKPRRDDSCSETRVARVVVVESLMSRRRCSTPISSASSASMADGAWRNVLRVSVPSCGGVRERVRAHTSKSEIVPEKLDGALRRTHAHL